MKRCGKCGLWKEESEFSKDKSKKDKLQIYCKKCNKQYRELNKDSLTEKAKQYRELHKDSIVKRQKQYYESNKNSLSEKAKKYYELNKDSIVKKNKKYRELNKDSIAKQHKKYRELNKEYLLKKSKQYYELNSDHFAEYKKQYYELNKDSIDEKRKLYYELNKDSIIEWHKQYRELNKDSLAEKAKHYRELHKDSIAEKSKKYQKSIALYEVYKNQLTIDESPRLSEDGVSLEVKCRYCGRYTKVTNQQVRSRMRVLNGNIGGEHSIYCLDGNCQSQCPVYGQSKYPKGYKKATSREVNPVLRQLVLKRDEYTCQECGKTIEEAPLHVHHIVPVIHSPIEANDPDNCITLCKSCHKIAHSRPGCGYSELKCANDDKIKQDYEASKEEHLKMDDEQESDQTSTKE